MYPIRFIIGVLLCIILVLVSSLLPSNLAYVSGASAGLGIALLGAFVVMWYDTSKENREKKERRKKALSVVHTDITQSLGPLETAPKEGELMLWQLPRMGWDILTMTGAFNVKSELDSRIADVYERLNILNFLINWSLSLRFSASQELESFPKARQSLNKSIHEQIDILLPRLKTIKTEIEKELGLVSEKKS